MLASCLLQGGDKNTGWYGFMVKTDCVFTPKTAKNRSKDGARMVQPWYGLGTAMI
jgi:hypothetical protein